TGALDSVSGEAVMRMLVAACRRGAAGVVVTHDAQFAACDARVVFLRDGRIIDQTRTPPGPESLLSPGPQRSGGRCVSCESCRAALAVAARPYVFQAEGGIRDWSVTGVQTCALPIWLRAPRPNWVCASKCPRKQAKRRKA